MSERNERKTKVGKVVSDKMDKTVVVAVEDIEQHALYKKAVKKTVKFKAHDENNEAHVGDIVSLSASSLLISPVPPLRRLTDDSATDFTQCWRQHRC